MDQLCPDCKKTRRLEANRFYNKQWRLKNPELHRALFLRFKYGLSIERYRELVKAAGGLCAICRQPRPLAVDHDHRTKEIRGLVCNRCNRHLAVLDDPEWIIAAQRYLAPFRT